MIQLSDCAYETIHVWLDSNAFTWGYESQHLDGYPADFSIAVAPWATFGDILEEIKNVCLYSKRVREIYEPLICS
jgi:hypothetical protein